MEGIWYHNKVVVIERLQVTHARKTSIFAIRFDRKLYEMCGKKTVGFITISEMQES